MALVNNNKLTSKLTDANHTPKLRQKNSHHLTIAPEQHEGSPTLSTPKSVRSARLPFKDRVQKEERLLGSSQPKIVIVPKGKSELCLRNPVKLTVGSTSSDSSDEKMTPPGKGPMKPLKKKAVVRSTSWKPGRGVGASPSLRSLKNANLESGNMRSNASWASFTFTEGPNSNFLRPMSDVISVRSLASIGMGSTDGKKLTIRRVPTSPNELLNIVEPNR